MDIRNNMYTPLTPPPAAPPPPPPPPPPEPEAPMHAAPRAEARSTVPPLEPGDLPDLNTSVAEAVERGLPLVEDAAADMPAMMQVFANRKLEKEALGALAGEVREKYAVLGELLDDAPRAHLGMQLDLLRGDLPKNALIEGFIPATEGTANAGASFTSGAVDWLKGKVSDLGKYAEKKLGLTWEEKPVETKAPTDQQVADKLGADPAHGLAFQAAYDKLSADDRARFDRVAAGLGDQPGAVKRLEQLLTDGKLTGAKDLRGGASLLENLDKLASQPLAPEIAGQRADLLASTIREIHDPTAVAQKHKNTCGAATVQSYLAASNPAEYVRLVAGLAGPEGKAEMQNGGVLKRDANFMDGSDKGRTISSRLLQPAIMNRSSIGSYDNKADGTPIPGLDVAIPGMFPSGMAGVMGELTGEGRKTVWNTPGFENHAYEGGTPSKPMPVLVNYPGDGPGLEDKVGPHWISVIGVDKAKGTVTYRNPWGQEETVSQKEFDKHVYAVVTPAPTGLAAVLEAL